MLNQKRKTSENSSINNKTNNSISSTSFCSHHGSCHCHHDRLPPHQRHPNSLTPNPRLWVRARAERDKRGVGLRRQQEILGASCGGHTWLLQDRVQHHRKCPLRSEHLRRHCQTPYSPLLHLPSRRNAPSDAYARQPTSATFWRRCDFCCSATSTSYLIDYAYRKIKKEKKRKQ